MTKVLSLCGVLALLVVVLALPVKQFDGKINVEDLAASLVDKMTLQEKIQMVHGVQGPYVGNTPAIPRLNIPALNLNDGPQGFRVPDEFEQGSSTSFPSALSMAATWDPALVYQWGEAMGKEFVIKGSNVLLGPGVCIARVPLNGRNFEYISGEDPLLGATLVQYAVRGIQDQGVIANAKHFVENNQETNRTTVSAHVDERTRFEIYYPPFQAAIEAGVGSFMCSYNRVNDVYACQNNETLGLDLRGHMGFKGWVMSDWGATHSTEDSALSGLDQEMPGGDFFSKKLEDAVTSGAVPTPVLDTMVTRILRSVVSVHGLPTAATAASSSDHDINTNSTSDAHNQLVRRLGASSTVLLKNDGILPLPHLSRIVVMGDEATCGGHGSGQVIPAYTITPAQGLANAVVGTGTEVVYVSGEDVGEAVEAARSADIAVIVVATNSAEGSDRPTLSLGEHWDGLVEAVAAAQPRTIVAVNAPGAVLLPWEDRVAAVLVNFMTGQECGNSLADVLYGRVNPGGKLPLTIPHKDGELVFSQDQYPGIDSEEHYSERLEVGYRWYHAHDVKPHFPFGHGLSYSQFELALAGVNMLASTVTVSLSVKNLGPLYFGSEVVQLYLDYPAEAGEPPRQLRAFKKVTPKAEGGHVSMVDLELTRHSFSIWSMDAHAWQLVPGKYTAHVGFSSSDIRAVTTISVTESMFA